MINDRVANPIPDLNLAREVFSELRKQTRDDEGITRQAYGLGEQLAHNIVRDVADSLFLEVDTDSGGNLYMTLPGQNRAAKRVVVGSHLDTVLRGGNYDGAAGVICGLSAVAGLVKAGIKPQADIVVMGIRTEEAVWFANNYTGSKIALGRLDPVLLDSLTHSASGRTLAQSIAEAGFDPDTVRRCESYLDPETVSAFIEPHIEQGPILETKEIPVGIVNAIRGNFRYRNGRCEGEYGHSGAVPLKMRRDAVAATVEFLHRLNMIWRELERAGDDLVLTCGSLMTDSKMHGFSRISGEVRFTLDVRSHSTAVLERMHLHVARIMDEASSNWRVKMTLNDFTQSAPALMDGNLRHRLSDAAHACDVPVIDIASGGGHDAAEFASAGIPTAMIFIRNANGSHNPNESMTLEDFGLASTVLIEYLRKYA